MKIGIEAQRIFRPKKHGMDMVVLELIRNLQKIDTQNSYIVYVKPDSDICLESTPNFKICELGGSSYPAWEQYALPKAAYRDGCDILHCTSNTGPLFCKVPLITTLHDIIYLESLSLLKKGGTAYQKFGNLYRRWVVPPVVKKSLKVVTVSEFERKRIKDFMGLGDNLISIYNGVGEHFTKITDKEILKDAKERYKLPDRFLFFLGNTDPKKNTPNVIKAFMLFNSVSEIKYKLVMLDYKEDALMQVLRDIGWPDARNEIHLTGYVPNRELPAIINQASLFLYPSLRESFGIPILEGMRCGVPVITSNTSSMPEVAGDAAELVDPANPSQIVNAISKILTNTQHRDELISKGYDRASKFSWMEMAHNYLKLYREVCSNIETKR